MRCPRGRRLLSPGTAGSKAAKELQARFAAAPQRLPPLRAFHPAPHATKAESKAESGKWKTTREMIFIF